MRSWANWSKRPIRDDIAVLADNRYWRVGIDMYLFKGSRPLGFEKTVKRGNVDLLPASSIISCLLLGSILPKQRERSTQGFYYQLFSVFSQFQAEFLMKLINIVQVMFQSSLNVINGRYSPQLTIIILPVEVYCWT